MQPIIPISEILTSRGRGESKDYRWYVKLPDGRNIARSRLVMMNYLHTTLIPSRIHIHHINKDTLDDSLNNLQIMRDSDHISSHTNPLKLSLKERRRLRKEHAKIYNSLPSTKKRMADWREEHKDELNEYYEKYKDVNSERLLAYRRAYYHKHREEKIAYSKEYRRIHGRKYNPTEHDKERAREWYLKNRVRILEKLKLKRKGEQP
jgi:hypothetical protein